MYFPEGFNALCDAEFLLKGIGIGFSIGLIIGVIIGFFMG